MYASSTVGPMLVKPQAIRRLWPTITNGCPGRLTPATSKSPECRCTSYHKLGIWCPRCISFESSGFPETVCAPETTQLFDPMGKSSFRNSGASIGSCFHSSSALFSDVPIEVTEDGEGLFSSGGTWSSAGIGCVGGGCGHELFTYRSAVSSGPNFARIVSRVSAACGLVLSVETIWSAIRMESSTLHAFGEYRSTRNSSGKVCL